MPSARGLRLIVNPASAGGRAARRLPDVEEALRARDPDVEIQSAMTHSLDHARELALEAAAHDLVAVAVGGDGLVSAVAGTLARADGGVLGIVPFGTGNDFARALGIKGMEVAVRSIIDGQERAVDVGSAGGKVFTCIASFGLDSVVVDCAERTRLPLGPMVYPYATVRSLLRWKPATFEIDIDGQRHSVTGYNVAVANTGAYGGGMWIAPDATPDDGMFDIVAIEHVSRLRFLAQSPKVFKGSHIHNPEVRVWRGRRVRLASDRPLMVYADGEPVGPAPIEVEVLPGALRVLVP